MYFIHIYFEIECHKLKKYKTKTNRNLIINQAHGIQNIGLLSTNFPTKRRNLKWEWLKSDNRVGKKKLEVGVVEE